MQHQMLWHAVHISRKSLAESQTWRLLIFDLLALQMLLPQSTIDRTASRKLAEAFTGVNTSAPMILGFENHKSLAHLLWVFNYSGKKRRIYKTTIFEFHGHQESPSSWRLWDLSLHHTRQSLQHLSLMVGKNLDLSEWQYRVQLQPHECQTSFSLSWSATDVTFKRVKATSRWSSRIEHKKSNFCNAFWSSVESWRVCPRFWRRSWQSTTFDLGKTKSSFLTSLSRWIWASWTTRSAWT